MKRRAITFLLSAIMVLLVLGLSSAKPIEAHKQEPTFARTYQSPMVVPEIKHQAVKAAEEVAVVSAPKEKSSKINAIITHYCACTACNGKWSYQKDGLNCTETASGILLYDFIDGNYCAATFGKIGDILTINGTDYQIVDRMGGNSGKRVDIFVADGHDKCNELGRYTAEVTLKGE